MFGAVRQVFFCLAVSAGRFANVIKAAVREKRGGVVRFEDAGCGQKPVIVFFLRFRITGLCGS